MKISIKSEKEVIRFIDDPNLVEYRTNLEGWTGADNLYYGKGDVGEQRARYANATHKKCKCGNAIEKTRYKCESCYLKSTYENFLKLPEIDWDGKSMIATYDDDKFFSSIDDAEEYCESNECDIEDLQLVACEKRITISEVNIDDLNEEYCTENGDGVSHYHPDIAEKVDELNKAIRNAKPCLWFTVSKRIKLIKK